MHSILRTQKERLVLIHASIGKEQRRIVDGHARTRRPKRVLVLLHKKVDKGRSDLVHGPVMLLLLVIFVVAHGCCASLSLVLLLLYGCVQIEVVRKGLVEGKEEEQ